MLAPSPLDQAFSNWLVQRSLSRLSSQLADVTACSIAIESPCVVCQPRIAAALAKYLNEFDSTSDGTSWLPVLDHQLEQLQANPELRGMLGQEKADDPESAVSFLASQGQVVLQVAKCHESTYDNPRIFQVSMGCKEPEEQRHHLWLNAKRIPEETLIPMIANSFLDWSVAGGDRPEE